MRELSGAVVRLNDPRKSFLWNSTRDLSPIYAAAELLWYLCLTDDGDQIKHYAPSYHHYLRHDGNGLVADGAYGKRWESQIQPLLGELSNPNSRRAVLGTWNWEDLGRDTNDCPCTLTLQFMRRDSKLDLIATMRSNDLWLGFPYDVFCFTQIQQMIAAELGCEPGFYQHQAGSLHLYDGHLIKAEQVAFTDGGTALRDWDYANCFESRVIAARHGEHNARHLPDMDLSTFVKNFHHSIREERGATCALLVLAWLWSTTKVPSLHELGLVMDGRLAKRALETRAKKDAKVRAAGC